MNDLDMLEDAAVSHMNWESNQLNRNGNMAFFGDASGSGQGPLVANEPAAFSPDWFHEPKNLAIIGLGAVALILLIMLLKNNE